MQIDGEPWFFGADICAILDIRNTGNAYRRLDADELTNIRRVDVGQRPGRDLVLVSRPGLFKLIQRSDKPSAREFDRWVRHEVLTQIMDNGGYITPDADAQKVAESAPQNTKRSDLDLMKTVMSAMELVAHRPGGGIIRVRLGLGRGHNASIFDSSRRYRTYRQPGYCCRALQGCQGQIHQVPACCRDLGRRGDQGQERKVSYRVGSKEGPVHEVPVMICGL